MDAGAAGVRFTRANSAGQFATRFPRNVIVQTMRIVLFSMFNV